MTDGRTHVRTKLVVKSLSRLKIFCTQWFCKMQTIVECSVTHFITISPCYMSTFINFIATIASIDPACYNVMFYNVHRSSHYTTLQILSENNEKQQKWLFRLWCHIKGEVLYYFVTGFIIYNCCPVDYTDLHIC